MHTQVDYESCTQEEHISGGEGTDPSLPNQGVPEVDGEASMGKVEEAAMAGDIRTTITRKLYQRMQYCIVDFLSYTILVQSSCTYGVH